MGIEIVGGDFSLYAGMLELADWTDLGSVVERRMGSSPIARTTCRSDGIGRHGRLKISW